MSNTQSDKSTWASIAVRHTHPAASSTRPRHRSMGKAHKAALTVTCTTCQVIGSGTCTAAIRNRGEGGVCPFLPFPCLHNTHTTPLHNACVTAPLVMSASHAWWAWVCVACRWCVCGRPTNHTHQPHTCSPSTTRPHSTRCLAGATVQHSNQVQPAAVTETVPHPEDPPHTCGSCIHTEHLNLPPARCGDNTPMPAWSQPHMPHGLVSNQRRPADHTTLAST